MYIQFSLPLSNADIFCSSDVVRSLGSLSSTCVEVYSASLYVIVYNKLSIHIRESGDCVDSCSCKFVRFFKYCVVDMTKMCPMGILN